MPQYYEVQRGDTLTLIAAAYQIPVQALMDANQLTNPDDIFAGQFLAIPRREDIVAASLPPTVPGPDATADADGRRGNDRAARHRGGDDDGAVIAFPGHAGRLWPLCDCVQPRRRS